jgi:regulator of protease activity HflC (stomatin/prohibitin superfamily)
MFKFINISTTGIKTTFGKFSGTLNPGLKFYVPFIQQIHVISNKLRENTFNFEIKTKDDVFANLIISVQYKIKDENSEKAFYQMESPVEQMSSYIENIIRVTAPTMTLDELYESQNEISQNVMTNVAPKMEQYGLSIENTLVKNIDPDKLVKASMNKINSSKRLKFAASEEAEAEYIKKVREAEADRDRKRLQGEGISAQRKAILDGYKESVDDMSTKFGVSQREIIDFVLKTQHLDMLEIIGNSPGTKTIFVDHNIQSDSIKLMQALENRS